MVSTWTPEKLAETVWALQRLLRLGRQTGIITPMRDDSNAISAYGASVEDWLSDVDPVLKQAQGQAADQAINVPAFPLTAEQLTDLESSIQEGLAVLARRQRGLVGRRATERWRLALSLSKSLDHLYVTLAAANRSSLFIIEVVACLFALNCLYLALVLVFHSQLLLTTNLVALAVVGNLAVLLVIAALWWRHHLRLRRHGHAVHMHTAINH
jgi:hypothetical protein